MVNSTSVERFMALFRGNPRSFGQWNPKEKDPNKNSHTKKTAYTLTDCENHIRGITGIGLVPIMDNATCFWGAIDIDNHGQTEDVDIKAIEQRVADLGLPLVVCRSKSGGAHLYLFGREPLRAVQVHGMLKKWAKDLNVLGVDCIFPKQTKLAHNEDGGRQLGNWINLPYFNAEDTNRYAVENGYPLPFELFLTLAETRAVTSFDLDTMHGNEHSEAPPCIAQGIMDGVDSGSRNEFAYNLTIYMKKRFPEEFRDRIYDMNNSIFKEPLPFIEIKKVVQSASRRDYRYKCGTEPCKSMCDRKVCLTRKFGITQDQSDEMDAEFKLPEFGQLAKYNTQPVRWELTVEGQVIPMSTEEMMDWRIVRNKIVERLMRMVPMIKNDRWHKVLEQLIPVCRVMDAPEDASTDGIVKTQLVEFMRKIDLKEDGLDMERRLDLFRGLPVVQNVADGKCVMFRGQDFVSFLKRNKTEDLKGVNLWFALKNIGVKHGRFRAGDKTPSLWYIPVTADDVLDIETPEFKPEY